MLIKKIKNIKILCKKHFVCLEDFEYIVWFFIDSLIEDTTPYS